MASDKIEAANKLFDPAHNQLACSIIEYFNNIVYISDICTIHVINTSIIDRINTEFELLSLSLLENCLQLISNITSSPLEATEYIFHHAVFNMFPVVLKKGSNKAKKEIIIILSHALLRIDIETVLEKIIILQILDSVIDMIYSDDDDLLFHLFHSFIYICSNAALNYQSNASIVREKLSENTIIDRIQDLFISNNQRISSMSRSLFNILYNLHSADEN